MKNELKIGFLPIGNIEVGGVKEDVNVALASLKKSGLEVISRPATTDPRKVVSSAKQLEMEGTFLLILFVSHGMQSQNVVSAVEGVKLPVIIWSLPVRYSLPTSASAVGNLRERGFRVKLICESPDAGSATNEILRTSKVAYTIRKLKEARIGKIGGMQYSNVASYYHRFVLRDRLGPEVVHIPINEVMASFNKITSEEIDRALEGILSKFHRVEVDEPDLKKSIKLHLAIKGLFEKYELSGITVECYTELGKIFDTNPCLGHLEDFAIGCEGDVVHCAASLLVKYLTGKSVYQADLLSVDYDKSVLALVHCSAPASLAEDASKVLVGTYKPPMELGRYVMAVCKPQIPPGPVTVFRLFGRNLDKIHMTMGESMSCELEEAMKVNIKVTGDLKKFIDVVSGNHYLVVPGDIKEEIRELCDWLHIQVIET